MIKSLISKLFFRHDAVSLKFAGAHPIWDSRLALHALIRLGPDYKALWPPMDDTGQPSDDLELFWLLCGDLFVKRYLAGTYDELDALRDILESFQIYGDNDVKDMTILLLSFILTQFDCEPYKKRRVLSRFGPESIRYFNEENRYGQVSDRYGTLSFWLQPRELKRIFFGI